MFQVSSTDVPFLVGDDPALEQLLALSTSFSARNHFFLVGRLLKSLVPNKRRSEWIAETELLHPIEQLRSFCRRPNSRYSGSVESLRRE